MQFTLVSRRERSFDLRTEDLAHIVVGILGATVMPHAIFLGSSLATQDRISNADDNDDELPNPNSIEQPTTIKSKLRTFVAPLFRISRAERVASRTRDYRSKYGERENNSLAFIQAHLPHAITDVITSLLALAVPINSASVSFVVLLHESRLT